MFLGTLKATQIEHNIESYVVRHDKSLPLFKHDIGDAGYDVYATEDKWIWPWKITKIPTNCSIELPKGFYAEVVGRSGQTTLGNIVHEGTVDNSYRGVIHIMMSRVGFLPRKIKRGTRVAQLIVKRYYEVKWLEIDGLSKTDRQDNGFGSSGIG